MAHIIFILANTILCGLALKNVVCILAHMTPGTHHMIRAAYVLLGSGLGSSILTPLVEQPQQTTLISLALLVSGLALLYTLDRRENPRKGRIHIHY